MRFVLLTDLHLMPEGQTLYALDPRRRLRAALAAIGRLHGDADCLVVTGDLAERGARDVYEILREELAVWRKPVLLLLGNHDFRAPFLEVFPDSRCDEDGFVQALTVYPDATLLALDTLDETVTDGSGFLCPRRLAFAERALREAPRDRPLLLFLHHPPMATGILSMDQLPLRNGKDLLSMFSAIRRPDYMFIGHLHRPVAGLCCGVPFHIQRGLSHQVGFDLQSPVFVPGSHEPPDYALVSVEAGEIVIHQNSFLYDGPQFLLDDRHAKRAARL